MSAVLLFTLGILIAAVALIPGTNFWRWCHDFLLGLSGLTIIAVPVSLIYIAMGWVCILAISKIIAALPAGGFAWLLAGGIIYTAGGIIYALKLPIFNSRHRYFGSHEIFHLFVMGGSLCHYMMMYQFVA